ncbi:hypothetical protein [Herbaspirillum robiniae]|uniref:hypothetical protein n=1 Tax=Herbaspirillum robiniae TaxID=2014887 RepID=UPI003D76C2F3
MTYNILFIDEEKMAHRSFVKDFLEKNKDRFSGAYTVPTPTLEEMMEQISESNPDVVLTDFSLNDKKADLPYAYTVEYNGGDIARELLARKKNFPIFIATSLGDEAARQGNDVKLIFEKYGSFKESENEKNRAPDAQHLTFADKIFYEVLSYKKSIESASAEFDSLIEKQAKSGLTMSEEERLVELDEVLESALDARSKLPESLRAPSNIRRLDDLILLAEKILAEGKKAP